MEIFKKIPMDYRAQYVEQNDRGYWFRGYASHGESSYVEKFRDNRGNVVSAKLALVNFNCDSPKINFKIDLLLQFLKKSLEI